MTVIAIDGPSGVGKSSVSREVARRLGYGYLDTGAMYRAMVCVCLHAQVSEPDEVLAAVTAAKLEISTDPDRVSVVVDGRDVTEEIRTPEVSLNAQIVSGVPEVREVLIGMQRSLIREATPGIVVEGRDITTVVAPDAEVRVLMTADEDVRIARRTKELHGDASAEKLATTRSQIVDRDAKDSATTSFLTAADGVHTLDTTHIDFPASVDAVLSLTKDDHDG